MIYGSGLRVQDLGFRVSDLRFRIRVRDFGLRIQGLRFRIEVLNCLEQIPMENVMKRGIETRDLQWCIRVGFLRGFGKLST